MKKLSMLDIAPDAGCKCSSLTPVFWSNLEFEGEKIGVVLTKDNNGLRTIVVLSKNSDPVLSVTNSTMLATCNKVVLTKDQAKKIISGGLIPKTMTAVYATWEKRADFQGSWTVNETSERIIVEIDYDWVEEYLMRSNYLDNK